MKPRHKRLAIAGGVVVAVGAIAALVLNAFQSNLVFFYSPSQIASHEAPANRTFRLGGLVQEKETIGRRQIPGLGSIPVVGWLFKKRHRQREKVNLLVVLVPHVLESPEDARRIHERRLEERREFLERESAFEHRDLDLHVDYRKKSGLLAAVQGEARHMDEELRLHEQAQLAIEQDVGRRIAPEGSFELGGGSPSGDVLISDD